MKLKTIAFWGLILAVLAAMVFLAFRPEPVPADFTSVTRGPLRVTIDEEGKTRVHDRYIVSAPLAGRVLRIELEAGDPVRAGQALAVIEPVEPSLLDARATAEIEAQVRAARAAVGQAEAEARRIQGELDFARAELRRQKELEAKGVVSRQQLEAAETDVATRQEGLQSADFAIQMARENLEMAQARLLETAKATPGAGRSTRQPVTVRAPVEGVVLRRLRESESVVPPGEPLLEIGNSRSLEIVSDLLSTEAVKVNPGDSVSIEEWGGERPLNGRVRLIEPSGFTKISALGVEEQRVNVIIDFTDPVELWSSLGDEFRVEIRIIVWEKPDILKIPTSSLFRHGEKWAVFRVQQGKATLTEVEIGRRNGLEAELLSGLREGDRLVAYPSDDVKDGVEVAERTAP